jgi:hypothetical protein
MKKLFLLVMIVFFIFSMGCGGGGGSSESADETAPVSSGKAITAFSFTSPSATGVISEATYTIDIEVPFGTDVNALTATFTTTGASVRVNGIDQVSGVTVNDFSYPLIYTVTATDATTQTYTVIVTEAAPSYIGSYSGSWQAGIILSGNIRFTIDAYSENSISGTIEDLKYGYGVIQVNSGYISGNYVYAEGSVGNLNISGEGTFSSDGSTIYGTLNANGIQGSFSGTRD